MQKSEIADLFKQIQKLESKIENTSIDVEKAGFVRNLFGGFDSVELTEDLLAKYAQLFELSPAERDIKYRWAAALSRARQFEKARAAYSDLISSHTSAILMLAMIELADGNRHLAERLVAEYNQRCVSEGMLFMQSSLEKIGLGPP